MIVNEYAKALFELSLKNNVLDVVNNEFTILNEALLNDNEAFMFFESPTISGNEKNKVLNNIIMEFNEILKRFLIVLLDNNRFDLLFDIYKSFHKLIVDNENKLEVTIKSVKKLNKEQIDTLSKLLSKKYNVKKIEIINIVDESIMGGIKAYIKDEYIDLSLNSKIDRLKASL